MRTPARLPARVRAYAWRALGLSEVLCLWLEELRIEMIVAGSDSDALAQVERMQAAEFGFATYVQRRLAERKRRA